MSIFRLSTTVVHYRLDSAHSTLLANLSATKDQCRCKGRSSEPFKVEGMYSAYLVGSFIALTVVTLVVDYLRLIALRAKAAMATY